MAGAHTAQFSPTTTRKATYRAHGCLPSRAHGGVTFSLETPSEDEPRHSPDACFLCRRPLHAPCDVFMYRGNAPFCSEDCRREQIELDAALERELSYRRKQHHHHRAASAKQAPKSSQQSLYAQPADAVVAS